MPRLSRQLRSFGSTWRESPAYESLPNTVKVVTVGHQDVRSGPVLLIQADGTVYALGGAVEYIFATSTANITGIDYGQYVYNLDHAGPSGFSFVFDLAILDDPIQLPWASNIVDASISTTGGYALYLDVAGNVFTNRMISPMRTSSPHPALVFAVIFISIFLLHLPLLEGALVNGALLLHVAVARRVDRDLLLDLARGRHHGGHRMRRP